MFVLDTDSITHDQNAHPTCLIQEQETLGIVPVFWKD
jgi:hypothetical protein